MDKRWRVFAESVSAGSYYVGIFSGTQEQAKKQAQADWHKELETYPKSHIVRQVKWLFTASEVA